MPNSDNLSNTPVLDYTKLVKFLLEPLLDEPETLAIDCEQVSSTDKVWVRVAFEQEDKGKVFGRGGRNLKAIEVVLNTSAIAANQQVYLDIHGGSEAASHNSRGHSGRSFRNKDDNGGRRTRTSRRPRTPKPAPQLRGFEDEN